MKAARVLGAAVWLAETQDTCGMCMLEWDRSCYREGLRAAGVLGAAVWLAETQDT